MANQEEGHQPQAEGICVRRNSRNIIEYSVKGSHMSVPELREQMWEAVIYREQSTIPNIMNYITKNIPPYPTPVKFEVSNVTHATGESGITKILESEGFGHPKIEILWWHLKIDGEEITSAEKQYVMKNDLNEESNQEEFLKKFTTSPAFKQESRYGNYHFMFPLTELMEWYKEQKCEGNEPILRVYNTTLYKQEIMYAVLIHSPEYNQLFKNYPLLEQSEFVGYKEGSITWKAQAICNTHQYQLIGSEVQKLKTQQLYVWDQVSLAFYLPNTESQKVLKVPRRKLIEALEACKLDEIDFSKYKGNKSKEERHEDAKTKVRGLRKEIEDQ